MTSSRGVVIFPNDGQCNNPIVELICNRQRQLSSA